MKTIIAMIAAAAMGVALGYVIVQPSVKKEAARALQDREALQTKWAEEKTLLELQLKSARNKPARIEKIQTPAAAGATARSPEQILESLKSMKVTAGPSRSPSIRRIIHQLESLSETGEAALPVIREFLGRFEDIDYGMFGATAGDEPSANPEAGGTPPAAPPAPGAPRNLAKLDFLVPPSLRLGLVDVVRAIGGDTAETVLAEMLGTTGRAVEVAYVARVLQEIAPNKYKDTAVAAAKELLANPPAVDRPNRLDANAKNYLYTVLAMYNDQSFSSVAHAILVTPDGQVDRSALSYLTTTLKEHAIPALHQAYKDPRLTNLWDKASIAGQALSYAGENRQANEIFKEVVGNQAMPSWMRAMTIQTLAGGTFFGGTVPTDPAQIQARLDLLNSLGDLPDERMAEAKADAIKRLNERLVSGAEPANAAGGDRAAATPANNQTPLPVQTPPE